MMRHYDSERLFRRMMRCITSDWYRYCFISKRGRRVKLVMKDYAASQPPKFYRKAA